MSKKGFTFKLSMGFWEAELIIKALENFTKLTNREKISKPDLIRHLKYQMKRAKESEGEE